MSRSILIIGATGNQGGAVLDALLAHPEDNFTLLAVTRNPESNSAKRLAAKSPSIKLVKGDLSDTPALFKAAREASPDGKIWGAYSVQAIAPVPFKEEPDYRDALEYKYGVAVIDEALKNGVQHFVYSSVERGGDGFTPETGFTPTYVPHFITKHYVEVYLREHAKDKMTWTILRPVAYLDNLHNDFFTKVFLKTLKDTMGFETPLQWTAVSDIGYFGGLAFHSAQEWNGKAVSIAGDELNFAQLDDLFKKITGKGAPTTFWFFGSALKAAIRDLGLMVDWFKTDGYGADIAKLRKYKPDLVTMEAYLSDKKTGFVSA